MSGIEYRKLELNDINCFIELRKIQLLEEGANAITDITDSLLDFYKRHLSDGTFLSWLAISDGEIIATSGLSIIERPPYYGNPAGRVGIVSSMYTVPSYRRQGIAKKLMNFIINEAKNNGCGAMQVTASDMGASFYQDFGFERNRNFFQYRLGK